VDEVDESITDVAGVAVVDWQIEKVELHFEVSVEFLE
jgi:hypothetical protein